MGDGIRHEPTPEAMAAQRFVGELVAKAWGCEPPIRTPRLSRVDYLLTHDGELFAVLEVKTHRHRYPRGVMLSAQKWVSMHNVSHAFGVRAFLAIAYPDGSVDIGNIAALDIAEVGPGGRGDRRDRYGNVDELDRETCVYLLGMHRLRGPTRGAP